jgi:hypothetical protein
MFIDAGPDFAGKTTPRTLRNRVAEVGKAFDLVKAKSRYRPIDMKSRLTTRSRPPLRIFMTRSLRSLLARLRSIDSM